MCTPIQKPAHTAKYPKDFYNFAWLKLYLINYGSICI